MIKLRNINKQYDRSILTNVNLDFTENNIYVIKGVSGCGKTTLLNILGGLDSAYTGTLEYGDYTITRTDEKRFSKQQKRVVNAYRNHVGYIFQQSLLILHLSIMENLLFIHNDKEVIYKYAKLLEVIDLLDKYPNELSNGERQRISIIRALILNSSIILADEPTASLDEKNSMEVVKAFLKIKDENKIVIIVTHEDCFDDVADYVWRLDYGVIEEPYGHENTINSIRIGKIKTNHYKQDAHYAKMKRKYNSKMFNFSLVSILVVILVFLGFYFHLEQGLSEYVYENYPYQTMIMSQEQVDEISNTENILKRYENYYLATDEYVFLPWLPVVDSPLNIPSALLYGEYPSNDNEIIIRESVAKVLFPDRDSKQVVGEEMSFSFDTTPYKISAILTDERSILNSIEMGYPIYLGFSENQATVFLSYDKLLEYGSIVQVSGNLYSVDKGAIGNPQLQRYVNKYSPWRSLIDAKVYGIDKTMDIFIICIPVILFLAFMFLLNMIYMDVLYRKSEFGYLQIFHVEKRRVYYVVFLEYLYRILNPVITAFLLYMVLNFTIIQTMHLQIGLQAVELSIAILFILVYLFLLVYYPTRKILKQSILEMINE